MWSSLLIQAVERGLRIVLVSSSSSFVRGLLARVNPSPLAVSAARVIAKRISTVPNGLQSGFHSWR
jgi:hypothetical protein